MTHVPESQVQVASSSFILVLQSLGVGRIWGSLLVVRRKPQYLCEVEMQKKAGLGGKESNMKSLAVLPKKIRLCCLGNRDSNNAFA